MPTDNSKLSLHLSVTDTDTEYLMPRLGFEPGFSSLQIQLSPSQAEGQAH